MSKDSLLGCLCFFSIVVKMILGEDKSKFDHRQLRKRPASTTSDSSSNDSDEDEKTYRSRNGTKRDEDRSRARRQVSDLTDLF